MWMHRLHIDKDALTLDEWAKILQNGDIGHKLIWRAFGDSPDRDRDFIFRVDHQPNSLTFHAICAREPDDWGGRFRVDSKPYHPKLVQGQLLQFQLRLNPSVAVKQPGQRRGKRRDIVAHARDNQPDKYAGMTKAEVVQDVGVSWLTEKFERHGFELIGEHTLVDQYSQTSFSKQTPTSRHHVQFSTMEFNGLCRVREPEKAKEALFEGIGRQKSFGMGMMMVKPL